MLSKRSTLGALALPLLAALCCGPVRAAELGEVKVNSFLGQQLSADIELVDLTAADLAEIQARLANPDVFKGAGLNVPPVLGGLYISVARRDNRRFLHLTTLQPVNNDALHLFLELSSGGRQIIRAATLWLTSEPPAQRAAPTVAAQNATPAAAPLSALAPAAQPASPAPSASAGAKRAVDVGEAGLSLAAERAFAARKQAAASSAAARTEGGPTAATAASTLAQAPASAPTPASVTTPASAPNPASATAPASVSAPSSAAVPASVSAPASAPGSKPAAKRVRAAQTVAPAKEVASGPVMPASATASAPACVPSQVEAQIQQCQAMTGKLVDLEGKVQRLQQALAPATMPALAPPPASMAKAGVVPAPDPVPAATANSPATATAPATGAANAPTAATVNASGAATAAAPTKPGAKPAKPGVSAELEAKSRTSTIMMAAAGAIALAALGGLIYFLRKRKGQGPLKIWQSFRKKEASAVVEPVMEEATAQE